PARRCCRCPLGPQCRCGAGPWAERAAAELKAIRTRFFFLYQSFLLLSFALRFNERHVLEIT
ncbi:hypothetical protein Nmel_008376, partial [Mimus melanotis]